jgi:KDEL-tailed cysteine endopeptidase
MYTGGIITDPSCGTNLDHGVLAVGYDTNQGFWKVKNSWGAGWGEQGYVRIGQVGDGPGICGILQAESFPTGVSSQ